jgi:hypothetical protein
LAARPRGVRASPARRAFLTIPLAPQLHGGLAGKQHASRVFYRPRRLFALPRTFEFVHTRAVVSNLERNCPMSMHSHLVELERRHKALEKEIENEKLHPATDDLHIVELKRKKLFLKDQIEKLRMRADEPERTLH